MNPQVITVSEFLEIINETLAVAYPEVTIEGEVSGFKVSQGKFVFFDLKDESSVLNCFMMAFALKLPIEDGMKIRVTGAPKVFPRSSKFSVTVKAVELAGEGELRRAMELLKAKLETEGLFDPARKRPLPAFPERIGLITSGTSAAYADFIKILGARWNGVEVLLADVSVQGAQAPDQVTGAIEYFNRLAEPVDILVIIRGGGSLEDLIAFSTEPVARAVATSRTPTVVGVGHEIDFSLADYAADVRAATPTDAARLIVPDRKEITARIKHDLSRTESALSAAVAQRSSQVDNALSRLAAYLRQPRERVQLAGSRLTRGFDRLTSQLQTKQVQVNNYGRALGNFERLILVRRRQETANLIRVLGGFDPQATLSRGYAIVRKDRRIVKASSAINPGDKLDIQLGTGTIQADVTTP